jgi:Tfp pilus assembly protein PilO
MKTMSRRERNLVLAAVAVALIIGVPGLLFPPSSARGKVRSLAAEQRARTQVTAEMGRAQAEVERLEMAVNARAFEGTERELVRRLVQAAQAAAKKASVRLDDLKPLPTENVSGLECVPVQVRLSSRFAEAARFLYEVQQQNPRCSVDQFRMVATDPRSDRLEIELRVVGYVKPDEESGNDIGI